MSIPKPSEDPNKLNRVPLESELHSLREVYNHNSRAAAGLEEQLIQAKQARDNIRNRYENALREVESLESALNASNNLVSLLQRQCDELGKERNQLAGLIHPVRRLNSDTLQTLFEWAVEFTSSQKQVEMTLTLSHVCQTWRKIAFVNQALWCNIDISVRDDIVRTKLRMLFIARRLPSMAPQFVLRGIGQSQKRGSRTLSQLLEAVNFDRFKSIKSIRVLLAHSSDCVQLDQADFKYGAGPLNLLSIKSKEVSKDSAAWDYASLLDRFPTVQRLTCLNLGTLVLEDGVFRGLKALHFEEVLIPTLPFQLSRLNGLEMLRLSGKVFKSERIEETIVLENLTELKIINARDFPWSKFNTPQLRNVAVYSATPETIDFLFSHPSIRDLQVSSFIDEAQFEALSTALPNLECLEVGGAIRKFFPQGRSKDTHPFPNLTRLFLDIRQCNIPLSSFERFIRSRCHAQRVEKKDNELQRLKSFAILDYTTDFDQSGLGTSKLLEGCVHEIIRSTDEDGNIVRFKMKWAE